MTRIALLIGAVATLFISASAHAQVGTATVSGPVTGGVRGAPFGAMSADALSDARYIEREYFFEGTATSYSRLGVWTADGFWGVTPATTADYKVRMLVRRPASAKDFNGIVVVEWLNVTALQEGAADFSQMQEEILREGYVWVGIGAQAAGVNTPGIGLKAWDPVRYGTLVHPGDRFSYDIFSQAAKAIQFPQGISPVGLPIGTMLATGRSQSAFRLVTYLNAFHPIVDLFDGFLIHSRGRTAAGLIAEGLAADPVPIPPNAHLRTDLDVPVLDVQTEGDMTALRSHLTRQAPHALYRRWEIAGAAHAETPRWIVEVPPPLDFGPGCLFAVNAAPHHAVVKAALRALTLWVTRGVTPPQSPDIELSNPTAFPPAIVRDAFGNAKGGIRLPELEVPTAVLDGRINVAAPPPPPQNFCSLFGGTVPFTDAVLEELYPNHGSFVSQFNEAVQAIVREGYWLEPEAKEARRAAAHSGIGKK